MDDFTVITVSECAAMKQWWLGTPYNENDLNSALRKLGIDPASIDEMRP